MLAARAVSIGLIPQGIALTSRAIFDNMTSEQAATVGFWSLAAILLALAVTRSFMIFGNIILSVRVEFTFATLLRKNVFDHILDQPGNNALPESTGEAVTRFREDVDYVNKYLQRIGFAFPLLVFGVIALYIMIGIDTIITFYVFLPLAVIMVTVSAASRWLRTLPPRQQGGHRRRDQPPRRDVRLRRGHQGRQRREQDDRRVQAPQQPPQDLHHPATRS